MLISQRRLIVAATVFGLAAAFLSTPRLAQDPGYHLFADQRPCGPIANCFNVLSNVPFALVGFAGVLIVARRRGDVFANHWERWPYLKRTPSALARLGIL